MFECFFNTLMNTYVNRQEIKNSVAAVGQGLHGGRDR